MRHVRLVIFVVLIALQVAIVGTMALSREWVLRSGDEVTLKTVPVDPRDLFRGDYVVLRYAISRINRDSVAWEGSGPYPDQTVWVVLEARKRYYVPVAVSDSTPGSHRVAIRGVISAVSNKKIRVRYGIEEYFVPEGTGWEIEQANRVDVVVAISDNGRAVIDHLLVDGTPWRAGDG